MVFKEELLFGGVEGDWRISVWGGERSMPSPDTRERARKGKLIGCEKGVSVRFGTSGEMGCGWELESDCGRLSVVGFRV